MGAAYIFLSFKLGIRNLGRNPRRTFLTLVAIAVGVWSSIAISMFARGISHQLVSNTINNLTGSFKIVSKKYMDEAVIEYSISMPSKALKKELSNPVIKGWAMRINVPAMIQSERESYGVRLVGVDPEQERGVSFIGRAGIVGRGLQGINDNGILIGRKLANLLKTRIGKRVVISTQDPDNHLVERGFKVVGLFSAEVESLEKFYVFLGRETAQELLQARGKISEISALLISDELTTRKVSEFRQMVDSSLEVVSWKELEPMASSVVKMQSGFLLIWAIIVVISIGFGLVNAMFMAIFERFKELGLFQALGMSPRQIFTMIVCESTVLVIFGLLSGNILGIFTFWKLAAGINLSRFAEGTQMINVGRIVYPVWVSSDIVVSNLVIGLLSVISSCYPAYHASKLTPVQALRKEWV